MLEHEQTTIRPKRPARGWARHIRREKAYKRKEAVRREMELAANHKPELNPSVKDYLLTVKERSSALMGNLSRTIDGRVLRFDWMNRPVYEKIPNPNFPLSSAELRLQIVWAEAQLKQLKPGSVENRVQKLIDDLGHNEGNYRLVEPVGLDDRRRPIPRYRQLLSQLEAGIPDKR